MPRVLSAVLVLVAVTLTAASCGSAGAPSPPVGASALPGDGSLRVGWSAPSDTSGLAGYSVVAQPGHHTCTAQAQPGCNLVGLANGTTYLISVRSTGDGGTSSAIRTKGVPGLPRAPDKVTGVVGDSTVTLSWAAPPADGSPVLGYAVTSNPGFLQCRTVTTTCTVSGLTNDTAYTFVVAASNAVGQGPDSSASVPYTPSAFAGGTPNVTFLGPVNTHQESTTGTVLQRDAGISVGLPNGRDLWIFGDTSSFSADSSQTTAFIGGSTAAQGRYVLGRTPTVLKDIQPAGAPAKLVSPPAQFIPPPTDTVMPDGSGRDCTPGNGAVYAARWPTGAALLDTPNQLLVTYTDVCVTSATDYTVEGWGWMSYDWQRRKVKTGPIDVFPPARDGASLSPDRAYRSPVVSHGQVTLFTSTCDQMYLTCTSGSVSATTVADSPLALATPTSYVGQPAVIGGTTPWTPVGISVAAYPSGLRLVEQVSIQGGFVVLSSASPTGPWHPFQYGVLPGCSTTPRGFCYAFVGHPELGSATRLVLSYFKPDSPQNANVGHVDLASVSTPAG